jgi:DNA gyrase subunit A
MEGIVNAYATGRGRVVVRAMINVEMSENGRDRIVVTEIPYQISKTTIIERIASLAREGKLEAIADLRDESDRRGMSLVIELKRGAQPRKVINQLYKHTPLQTTFGVQMLALVNSEPRLLSLKAALRHYINHRREVIDRRTRYDLDKAQRRAHILEGLLIAMGHLDAIIATIRKSADAETAREALMANFNLSEAQAQAILDMQLRRLSSLEQHKIQEEYDALKLLIAEYEDLLAHPKKILYLIRDDLNGLAEKYGDRRQTKIVPDADDSFNEEDLVPDEDVLVFITSQGYVKRVAASDYRTQHRGGKGLTGITTRENDDVSHLFAAGSHDSILFFSDRGKVYQEKAYQIPEASRIAKGMLLSSVLALDSGEHITAALPVQSFEEARFFTMTTVMGRIKRVEVAAFEAVRPSGLIAMSLDEGDELRWVKMTKGDQDLIIVTAGGQSIRFNEDDVRPMGRAAGGVNAIKLQENDVIASMDVVDDPEATVLVVTQHGYGKRTPVAEYPTQARYGQGVRTLSHNDVTGLIIGAYVVVPGDQITLITQGGMALRTPIDNISEMGRSTRGVQLMNLGAGDVLVSVALLEEDRRVEREKALQAETDALQAAAAQTPEAEQTALPLDEIDASEAADTADADDASSEPPVDSSSDTPAE